MVVGSCDGCWQIVWVSSLGGVVWGRRISLSEPVVVCVGFSGLAGYGSVRVAGLYGRHGMVVMYFLGNGFAGNGSGIRSRS